jgi:hypothetical protein
VINASIIPSSSSSGAVPNARRPSALAVHVSLDDPLQATVHDPSQQTTDHDPRASPSQYTMTPRRVLTHEHKCFIRTHGTYDTRTKPCRSHTLPSTTHRRAAREFVAPPPPDAVATDMLLLFETPAGYSLFKVKDEKKLSDVEVRATRDARDERRDER